jgi:hypothetical protein
MDDNNQRPSRRVLGCAAVGAGLIIGVVALAIATGYWYSGPCLVGVVVLVSLTVIGSPLAFRTLETVICGWQMAGMAVGIVISWGLFASGLEGRPAWTIILEARYIFWGGVVGAAVGAAVDVFRSVRRARPGTVRLQFSFRQFLLLVLVFVAACAAYRLHLMIEESKLHELPGSDFRGQWRSLTAPPLNPAP